MLVSEKGFLMKLVELTKANPPSPDIEPCRPGAPVYCERCDWEGKEEECWVEGMGDVCPIGHDGCRWSICDGPRWPCWCSAPPVETYYTPEGFEAWSRFAATLPPVSEWVHSPGCTGSTSRHFQPVPATVHVEPSVQSDDIGTADHECG